ncbi:rhomboid family intramembrane serine protease [Daejeonella lutea]|uniref:Membrane associated serine protease, rhomboid family n=1 Tax=Daejeonella lutea TaxID=572036 RepID=A0A1T5CUZ2_9SPHI|nr:rhomboid family intramembrane serine protease [Daejeonella lutea]SKB63234.1 Membrane associated serine protease, rhomboid family [Daejeonella lutea]
MNRSVFNELYYKVFQSGSPLYLFIGLNVIIFLAINLLAVGEFLTNGSGSAANWLQLQLSMPATFELLLYKFWTIITYMFTQSGFFHLLFNMLWLYWLGIIFLDFLNKRQFIFTYLAGGIMGAIFYLLAYNFIPVFSGAAERSILLGSSASVMAVVFAAATLVPDFTIRLLFLGGVKLKYLALAYFVLNIIGISSQDAGGSIAHIGGAFMGFIYIRQLKGGRDLSNVLKRRSKLKVVKNKNTPPAPANMPNQEIIDGILDKISQSGYDSLTKLEKEQLFKASKK